METFPKISVIMGIYNCASTLEQAVNSLIAQTYTNWELIMCDDGSTDATYDVATLLAERDQRIVLIQNERNRGLNYTLNKCLQYATGYYIARMDGDDLCSADRFEKEIAEFEANPTISIVSSNMTFFDENGTWGQTHKKAMPVKKDFLKETPFCHAPCMVKREAFLAVDGYTDKKSLLRVEDYHLWLKMYKAGFVGKNIQEPLYAMRDDRDAYRRRKFKYRINEAYVRALAVKELKLPLYGYVFALRPILVGLMPAKLYDLMHKMRLK